MIDVIDKPGQDTKTELDAGNEEEMHSSRNYVYCATCSSVLANIADRIEVNGSHDHTLTNPHNFTFHLGCYSQALGCTISGSPNAADTWFAGFKWRICTCSECNMHLGWYFDGRGDDFFYGLILDRIQFE